MKRWTHRASLTLATFVVGVFFCVITANASWFGNPGSDYSQSAATMYLCANPSGSAVVTQAGVSLSSPTLSLYNPVASGKNLVILEVGILPTTIPAA